MKNWTAATRASNWKRKSEFSLLSGITKRQVNNYSKWERKRGSIVSIRDTVRVEPWEIAKSLRELSLLPPVESTKTNLLLIIKYHSAFQTFLLSNSFVNYQSLENYSPWVTRVFVYNRVCFELSIGGFHLTSSFSPASSSGALVLLSPGLSRLWPTPSPFNRFEIRRRDWRNRDFDTKRP